MSVAPDFSHNAKAFTKILFPLKFVRYIMVFSFIIHYFSLIGIRMQTMQIVLANCYGFCSLYNTQQQLLKCKN